MPVSTDTRPNCTHCQEGGQSESDRVVWRIQLDQDLVDTLVGIYPEWFNVKPQPPSPNMATQPGATGAPPPQPPPPLSPPKAEVDESPLQKNKDKNKESLKVKLMLRRPINQLVAQGIMPPLKTPPAFHEQRQKLERAKMGDLLKAKIQQRPDRQELVRQHILEDVGHVDPSLAERQRMLKKCRLADSLNDQLSHRPGPLELIKKNILHTDEPIERAVKEGHIEFKATCEGQKTKPQPPDHYMTQDDDSQSSEATSPHDLLSSPPRDLLPDSQGLLPSNAQDILSETHDLLPESQDALNHRGILHNDLSDSRNILPETKDLLQDALTGSRDVLETAAAQAGIVTVVVAPPGTLLATAAPSPSLSLTSSLSPLSSISSPPSASSRPTPQPCPAPGKDKNRKKCKTKTQPKTRTIKFHEYKGPPNAHKTSPLSASPVETSYELLLQQQQLFLQWQLEWQHKYPQIILPASQKPQESQPSLITVTAAPPPPPPPPAQPPPPPPPQPIPDTRPLRNLEDMKVSDLKAELKKRNLPVSGAKPQLIERLKPFSESANTTSIPSNAASSPDDSVLSICHVSPQCSIGEPESPPNAPPSTPAPSTPASPASSVAMETELSEEIIREQRRRIEQLQRQLLRSQMQLQQQQQQQSQQPTFQSQPSLNAKASLAAFLQQQQLNQLLLQQSQQQQQQQQQLLGIINNNTSSNNNNNNSNNNNNNTNNKQQQQRTNGFVSSNQQQQQQAIMLNQINLKGSNNAHHHRTCSLPNFLGTFVQAIPGVLTTESTPEQQQQLEDKTTTLPPLPPPLYHDATKLLRVKQEVDNEEDDIKGVKSQIVDDVLEILIKNGELPPSAAQDPPPTAIDLHELGLDMETLDSHGVETMDLGDSLPAPEFMDVDTDWLDSLMEPQLSNGTASTSHDPLLPQDPFDLFNLDETDFKMTGDFGWDRVDYAT